MLKLVFIDMDGIKMTKINKVLINIHHDINDADYVDGIRIMRKSKWEKYKKLLLKARSVYVPGTPIEDPIGITGKEFYDECKITNISENEYKLLKKLKITNLGAGLPELDEQEIKEESRLIKKIRNSKKVIKSLVKSIENELLLNKDTNINIDNSHFKDDEDDNYYNGQTVQYFMHLYINDGNTDRLYTNISICYDGYDNYYLFIKLCKPHWHTIMPEGWNSYKINSKASLKDIKNLLLTYIKIYEEYVRAEDTSGSYDKCNELRLSLMKYGHHDIPAEAECLANIDFYYNPLKPLSSKFLIPNIVNFQNGCEVRDIKEKLGILL